MRIAFIAISILLIAAGCGTSDKNTDYKKITGDPILYARTVKELNNVVMQNNFPPIIASRNYLYANIAAYEIIAAGNPDKFRSLAGQVKDLISIPAPPKGEEIDFNFAALLAFCKLGEAVTFPAGSMKVYLDSIKQLVKGQGMPSDVFDNSVAYAELAGNAILDWSKKDNYAQTRTAPKYDVKNEPGRWIPTPPMYSQALEPHWNQIRPIAMDSGNQLQPPPPPEFNMDDKNSMYYKEVLAIKNAGDSLTDDQKHIAEFWDDLGSRMNVAGHVMFISKKFSPTGHWMNIVGIAAEKAKFDYENTVYAYAKTSISMFDAFIQCWDEKFRSNTARPETVIKKYVDPDWSPYLQTPPFPEYTCGHSTVSSAAAESLTDVFGDNFAYTDSSELEFGIANRSFKSFRHAAEENNWGRFYGGIHFHNSCMVSSEYGRKVADLVNTKLEMKK